MLTRRFEDVRYYDKIDVNLGSKSNKSIIWAIEVKPEYLEHAIHKLHQDIDEMIVEGDRELKIYGLRDNPQMRRNIPETWDTEFYGIHYLKSSMYLPIEFVNYNDKILSARIGQLKIINPLVIGGLFKSC